MMIAMMMRNTAICDLVGFIGMSLSSAQVYPPKVVAPLSPHTIGVDASGSVTVTGGV